MKQNAALTVFKSSAEYIIKNTKEIGFELLGFDFMIDDSLKVWLIEVNQNPCLSTLSPKQEVLINKLVEDVLRCP